MTGGRASADAVTWPCPTCEALAGLACPERTCDARLVHALKRGPDPRYTKAKPKRKRRAKPKRKPPPIEATGERRGGSALVTLPLPPQELSPNRRPHRQAKARATKRYRALARDAAAQAVDGDAWERVTVSATFFHAVRRRRDDVNQLAALKAAYDGIVDSGLIEDDDAEHLTTLPATFAIDKERPRVELRITKREEGA